MNTEIKRLVKAIDAISADTQRDKLRWTCQLALSQLARFIQTRNTTYVIQTDWSDFGFTELQANPKTPPAWSVEVLEAYLAAVQSNDPWMDIFSEIHAAMFDSSAKQLSQHFTPNYVAQKTLKFLSSGLDHKKESKDLITVCDPCCGSGVLVLAQLNQMEIDGFNINRVELYLNDKDPLCCAMTLMQLMANIVVHGKSIGGVIMWCSDLITEYHTKKAIFAMGPYLASIVACLNEWMDQQDQKCPGSGQDVARLWPGKTDPNTPQTAS